MGQPLGGLAEGLPAAFTTGVAGPGHCDCITGLGRAPPRLKLRCERIARGFPHRRRECVEASSVCSTHLLALHLVRWTALVGNREKLTAGNIRQHLCVYTYPMATKGKRGQDYAAATPSHDHGTDKVAAKHHTATTCTPLNAHSTPPQCFASVRPSVYGPCTMNGNAGCRQHSRPRKMQCRSSVRVMGHPNGSPKCWAAAVNPFSPPSRSF